MSTPGPGYTRERLAATAAVSVSLADMLRRLGTPPRSGARDYLRRRLIHHGIDTSHFARDPHARRPDIDETELRRAVEKSVSVAGVLRALGLPDSGAMRRRIGLGLTRYAIPTAHFTGQGHRHGRSAANRVPAARILRRLPPGSPRTRRPQLHRALQGTGAPYVCAECGTGEEWHGRRLVLEIDHVNGDRLDNRARNLRYLCPSCHSQTGTFANRAGGTQ
ncbi:HNH endonuclease signature motif containing protein [Streptomyces daliensis]